MGSMIDSQPRNIYEVLTGITRYWSPKTIATANDYDARVVKVQGTNTGDAPSELTAERQLG